MNEYMITNKDARKIDKQTFLDMTGCFHLVLPHLRGSILSQELNKLESLITSKAFDPLQFT